MVTVIIYWLLLVLGDCYGLEELTVTFSRPFHSQPNLLRMTLQNCTPYLSSYMLTEKVELIGCSVCPDK